MLDPTGQNLRVREDAQVSHLSFLKKVLISYSWFCGILYVGLICVLLFQGTYVEGIKEEVVLSPGHALSFIAAGEGAYTNYPYYIHWFFVHFLFIYLSFVLREWLVNVFFDLSIGAW